MTNWLLANKRCALFAGMGIGKSSATLFVLDTLRLLGELNDSVLVIGPMRVARDTWPEEVTKWDQFKGIRIMPIIGTPQLRLKRLAHKADIYTISYELLPWLVDQYLAKWPFRTVIADESDRLKGFREKKGGVGVNSKGAGHAGKRAHSIGRVAHNLTERWINLTGTPSPNGLKDLWGQTWFIDRGERLGRTYGAFKQRWFKPSWNGYGIEPMPHADREIHESIKDICLTVDPKDYFDLKDPIVTQVRVALPPAARVIYDELEKEMFYEFSTTEKIEAFNAAALTNKCRQLANGAVYTEYPQWKAIHDGKIEALESVVSESGGSGVLVAYSFKSDLARLKKAFPKAVELSTEDGMRSFRSGHAQMGLAHPKSMGHGIDGLQHVCNILVRFGHDWNLGERMQMLERVGPMRQMQAGFARPVFVYDIVAANTIDDLVIDAHESKRSVQDALLEACKRRT